MLVLTSANYSAGSAHPDAGPHALPGVRAVSAQLLRARAAARGAHRAAQVHARYPPAGTLQFRFPGSFSSFKMHSQR